VTFPRLWPRAALPSFEHLTKVNVAFQIDVAVNATEAGTITELLANEEDTVTVGQDLAKIDASGAKPESSSQEPAKEEGKTEAKPAEPETKKEPQQESKPESSKPAPPPPEPKKEAASTKQEQQPSKDASASTASTLGNREERRVCP
jgi:2-oxoglutarate dehydrogenase E2 component (dihydrolipoamide succinyltransferase)